MQNHCEARTTQQRETAGIRAAAAHGARPRKGRAAVDSRTMVPVGRARIRAVSASARRSRTGVCRRRSCGYLTVAPPSLAVRRESTGAWRSSAFERRRRTPASVRGLKSRREGSSRETADERRPPRRRFFRSFVPDETGRSVGRPRSLGSSPAPPGRSRHGRECGEFLLTLIVVVAKNDKTRNTLGGGSLGSCVDEERSQLR